MALLIRNVYQALLDFDKKYEDPYTSKIGWLSSPVPTLLITLCYLLFVLKIGPRFMRDRQPYNIKNLIHVYNFLQILVNAYMFVKGIGLLYPDETRTMGCIGTLPLDHRYKSREIQLSVCYIIVKVLDYMDTIFFVLRKSFKQISFLHVYHHVLMVLIGYVTIKYYGVGGQHVFIGIINAFVHTLMYGYYSVSAAWPSVKYTPWKEYITRIQIIQFVAIILHQLWPLYFRPDCQYSFTMRFFSILQAVIMLFLFGNFYLKSYIKRRDRAAVTKSQ